MQTYQIGLSKTSGGDSPDISSPRSGEFLYRQAFTALVSPISRCRAPLHCYGLDWELDASDLVKCEANNTRRCCRDSNALCNVVQVSCCCVTIGQSQEVAPPETTITQFAMEKGQLWATRHSQNVVSLYGNTLIHFDSADGSIQLLLPEPELYFSNDQVRIDGCQHRNVTLRWPVWAVNSNSCLRSLDQRLDSSVDC